MAGYTVLEGTIQVATATTNSATVDGLAPGSTHTYTVTAHDPAGNVSKPSNAVTATTSAGGGGGGTHPARSPPF